MLQARELIQLIAHKVDSSDQGAMSGIAIINEAGRFLFGLRPWAFRLRPDGVLALVAAQQYCALPADFGRMAGDPMPHPSGARSRWMQMTTYETILKLRGTQANVGASDGSYVGALVAKDASPSGPPTNRIEIWPTPTASDANGFKIPYFAKWVDVVIDTDFVNIPDYVEGLLRHMVRETAAGYENDAEKSVWERMDAIVGSAIYVSAVSEDAGMQPNLGPPQSGAAESVAASRGSAAGHGTFYPVLIP